jgi:tetratricopeptide (TPR) repeat protein
LAALEPGSDAYAGNANTNFLLHWWSRDFAGAIKVARENSDDDWSDQVNVALPRMLYVAWALEAAGDKAAAADTYAQVQKTVNARLQQQPDRAELHLALGFADAGLGLKADAVRAGRRAADLLPVTRDALSGAAVEVYLAQVHVRTGDNDTALDLLRQAVQHPSGGFLSPALLKLDPNWDSIRNDPRFAQLLKLGEGPIDTKNAQ